MQLTLRRQLTQFGHILQSKLFPALEEELGELSEPAKRLVATLEMIPLARFIPSRRGWMGSLFMRTSTGEESSFEKRIPGADRVLTTGRPDWRKRKREFTSGLRGSVYSVRYRAATVTERVSPRAAS